MFSAKVYFCGDNNTVTIGDNCSLAHCLIQVFDNDNKVIIGDHNSWAENVKLVPEEGSTIKIGSDCQFAVNIVIRSSDGHSIISNENNKRINPAKDITIGDRIWLGENVKVLKGAVIQSDCIIGAATIVTKGIYESNSVYVGNPVRQVKKNVHWVGPRIKD